MKKALMAAAVLAMVMCSGCVTDDITNRLGITSDFATTQAKAYAVQYLKEKGLEQYADASDVEAIIDRAKVLAEADPKTQEALKNVLAKKATTEAVNGWIQKIIDSGAVPIPVPATTNAVVTQ